jgi:dipeptidyl aminopeptidase/acylaminoacyl peptidase
VLHLRSAEIEERLLMVNRKTKKKPKAWGIVGIALLALLIFLLIPFVLRGQNRAPLKGPALADIDNIDISFPNGDLRLAGMLILPEGQGPFPTAIVIHGSGTSRRDNPWYLSIAKHLSAHGIAAVLPDKRGSEKSAGDWRGASFHDLAGDTLSAVEYVKAQQDFRHGKIGLIGMSQGGWIAPIAASMSDDISFVVSMSGAGVTTDEQLLFEEINNINEMGTYRFLAKLIAPITTRRIQRMDFWLPIAEFDPIPFWEQVEVPTFAAFGEHDRNVPVEESIERLKSIDRNIITKVYADGGHGITDPLTGEVQAAFFEDLVEFIGFHEQNEGSRH